MSTNTNKISLDKTVAINIEDFAPYGQYSFLVIERDLGRVYVHTAHTHKIPSHIEKSKDLLIGLKQGSSHRSIYNMVKQYQVDIEDWVNATDKDEVYTLKQGLVNVLKVGAEKADRYPRDWTSYYLRRADSQELLDIQELKNTQGVKAASAEVMKSCWLMGILVPPRFIRKFVTKDLDTMIQKLNN